MPHTTYYRQTDRHFRKNHFFWLKGSQNVKIWWKFWVIFHIKLIPSHPCRECQKWSLIYTYKLFFLVKCTWVPQSVSSSITGVANDASYTHWLAWTMHFAWLRNFHEVSMKVDAGTIVCTCYQVNAYPHLAYNCLSILL